MFSRMTGFFCRFGSYFCSDEKTNTLFKAVDNAPLILFRMVFGTLFFWHCIEAIFSGWVRRNLILPQVTFTHIGMEWLQPLPGNGMYFYFGLMALLSLMVAMGWYYRLGISALGILWTDLFHAESTPDGSTAAISKV